MARPGGDRARDDSGASPVEHPGVVLHLAKGDHAGPFPSPAHRPPAFWSSFIGRGQDVEELAALLASARLVTLTGPGGMGKTRLAVEVAERVAPGRAFFVDLAPVRDPALVAEEIANAFAVGELRGRDLADVLSNELPTGVFLVLDNCEHLIGACSEIVHRLLARCRALQILATSQQRLGVTGEAVWRVASLTVPEPVPDVTPEVALDGAAVQLFCERAQALSRDFTTSPANLAAIVEICWRLDGNPLAIELAAACTDVLSPSDIAARLEDRFGLLRRGDHAGPARHQTLAAALRWSDELLSAAERTLLRRLSVFAGGFSLHAAEEVCAGPPVAGDDVLTLLSGLVAKSLVVADTGGAVTRYRLLETVRHYAADGLTACGEAPALGERHAIWCLELADQGASVADPPAGPGGEETGPDNVHDNTRAALAWCLEHERSELALRLAAAQMKRWEDSGRFAEAREWLERVVAASGSAPAGLRAAALHDAGFASFMLGDFDAAHRYIGESLELWAESGDVAGAERTQGLLGFISAFGRGPSSVDELEAGLEQLRAAGDDVRLAEALTGCGQARFFRGEPVAAQRHFEELVTVARRSGNDTMLATGLVGLGAACVSQGAYGAAADVLHEGTALASTAGEAHTEAGGRTWLAELARRQGEYARAKVDFEECLRHARSLGAPYPLASALLGLGTVLLHEGEAPAARPLFEEAAGVADQAGLTSLMVVAVDGLGEVAMALGDVEAARARLEEALGIAGQCSDRVGVIRSTYHLGELARAGDDLVRAVSLHNEALKQRHETGDRAGVADSLDALAGLAAARENYQVAGRVFGAAETLRRAAGFARPPYRETAYQADVGLLRANLAPEDLERAWAQGAAMSANEAVAYVLRGRGSRVRPPKGPDSLTRAEREVVDLVCEGLTNPEIAARLFISPRTVQSHLRKAYARLGVKSRGQLRQVMAERRTPT